MPDQLAFHVFLETKIIPTLMLTIQDKLSLNAGIFRLYFRFKVHSYRNHSIVLKDFSTLELLDGRTGFFARLCRRYERN
jgi:hypothetical protein